MNNKVMKTIYLVLGIIFAGVGAIGVILPVLPTTPFLLLASFFLAKGSSKFHYWFTSTKLYKKHLNEFVKTKAMPLKTKWIILLPASAMLFIAFLICPIWHGRVLIIFAFLFKYYYFFFRIKTTKKGEMSYERRFNTSQE